MVYATFFVVLGQLEYLLSTMLFPTGICTCGSSDQSAHTESLRSVNLDGHDRGKEQRVMLRGYIAMPCLCHFVHERYRGLWWNGISCHLLVPSTCM